MSATASTPRRHTTRQQTVSRSPADHCRILVVDAAGDAAESLAMMLRNWRHQVQVAQDGPAALEASDSFRPDLVLLEIDLPGIDGFEVARRLRAFPESQETLVVALTAWASEEDRRRCFEAGFDGHMPKPVEVDALRQFLSHPRLLKKMSA